MAGGALPAGGRRRHWSAGGNGLLALAEFHARYETASQGHPFRWNCWNICAVDPLAICQKLWLLRSRVSFETARRAVGRHVMSCRCEMRPNFICLSLPAKLGRSAFALERGHALYLPATPILQPILHTLSSHPPAQGDASPPLLSSASVCLPVCHTPALLRLPSSPAFASVVCDTSLPSPYISRPFTPGLPASCTTTARPHPPGSHSKPDPSS